MGCTLVWFKFSNAFAFFVVFVSLAGQMAPLFNMNIYFDCKTKLCLIVPGRHSKIYFYTRKFLSTRYSQLIKEQDTSFLDCKHKHRMKSRAPDKVLYRMLPIEFHGFTSRIDF